MTAPLKIGLIGLDTSHVVAFTKIFNDPTYEFHLPGAKVTHGYAGGSPDLDVSIKPDVVVPANASRLISATSDVTVSSRTWT